MDVDCVVGGAVGPDLDRRMGEERARWESVFACSVETIDARVRSTSGRPFMTDEFLNDHFTPSI